MVWSLENQVSLRGRQRLTSSLRGISSESRIEQVRLITLKLVVNFNLIGVFEPTIKLTKYFIIAAVNCQMKPSWGKWFYNSIAFCYHVIWHYSIPCLHSSQQRGVWYQLTVLQSTNKVSSCISVYVVYVDFLDIWHHLGALPNKPVTWWGVTYYDSDNRLLHNQCLSSADDWCSDPQRARQGKVGSSFIPLLMIN